MKKITHKKIIISGDFIELFEFQEPILYGPENIKSKRYCDIKKENTLENRKRSLETARGNLKRIINANAGKWEDEYGRWFMPIFLTLTFAENMTDIKKANRIFSKFKQRLDYEITGQKRSYLKYVGIIEFQKRGAVHYHILFFNLPYLENIYDKMTDIWKEGFIIIKPIKNIKTVASYVCKYMTKSNADERLCGKKSYFSSNGLKRPLEILDEKRIDSILNNNLQGLDYREDSFKNDFCGQTKYRIYNVKDLVKNSNKFLDEIKLNLIENKSGVKL